jgi:hypothetical protein
MRSTLNLKPATGGQAFNMKRSTIKGNGGVSQEMDAQQRVPTCQRQRTDILSAPTVRGDSQTGQSRGVGRAKSENCKTNPSLSKPAWKIVPDKAKNEPIFTPERSCGQGQNE